MVFNILLISNLELSDNQLGVKREGKVVYTKFININFTIIFMNFGIDELNST